MPSGIYKRVDNKIVKVCKTCGKEFKVYPCRKDKAIYCSRKCRRYSKKTRKKISESHLGEKQTEERKIKRGIYKKGKNANHWTGGFDRKRLKKEWVDRNRNYVNWTNAKRRALNKGAEGCFTFEEWELLKKQYGYTCPYCGRKEPIIKLTIDHIIPLSKGGSNWIENIQPLCGSCNSRKKDNIYNNIDLIKSKLE